MTEEETAAFYGAVFKKLVQKARTNYLAFYTLMALRPDKTKTVGSFHEFLCRKVQRVFDRVESSRQTTSAPPQHGKTDAIVRVCVAWLMGRYPGIQIGLAAWDYALVEEISSEAREIVQHPWFKLVFPDAVLDDRINRIVNWGTTQGSRMRSVSQGRRLVGRRVDVFFGDDLYSGRSDVEKKDLRAKVRKWFFSDCLQRLSPNAIVWLIGTRWHPEDLCGYIHSEEYVKAITATGELDQLYQHTNFPALCENEETDPLDRSIDEALCPQLGRDEKFLRGQRASMPPYEWNSLFQGRPQPESGQQVDLERLMYIDAHELPREGMRWATGWDLATTEQQRNDPSAAAKCAWHAESRTLYIGDVWNKRLAWPKLKRVMIKRSLRDAAVTAKECDMEKLKHVAHVVESDLMSEAEAKEAQENRVLQIGIEGVSGFTIGFSEIRDALRGHVRVRKKNPPKNIDKLTRALPWLNLIDDGRVVIVRGAWNKDFIDQLQSFPSGDHDDMIDAVSIAREMLTAKAVPQHA
jgi:predicted phage terminase large subunit-like protein